MARVRVRVGFKVNFQVKIQLRCKLGLVFKGHVRARFRGRVIVRYWY